MPRFGVRYLDDTAAWQMPGHGQTVIMILWAGDKWDD